MNDMIAPDPDCAEGCNTGHRRLGMKVRFMIFAVLMSLLVFMMVSHIFELQVIDHEEYRVKSQKRLFLRYATKKGQRGRIFDRNGNILADEQPTLDVYVEPARFRDRIPEVRRLLQSYIGVSDQKFADCVERGLTYHIPMQVATGIDQIFADAILQRCPRGVKLVPLPVKNSSDEVFYKVLLYPRILNKEELEDVSHYFCQIFAFTPRSFRKRIKRNSELCVEVPLKKNVPLETGKILFEQARDASIRGIRLVESYERTYPRDTHLANVMGFLDHDRNGVSGIEKLMDEYLQPRDGRILYKRDRWGHPVDEGVVVTSRPENGADIYLTIHEPIQQIVEEELGKIHAQYRPDHAFALMMDPRTGAVMALAQFPQFNPNDRENILPELVQNHILVQSFEPGSIFKPFTVALAIENRVAGVDTNVFCENGRWYFGGRPLRDTHGFGNLTVAQILQKSSNIGSAKLAIETGEQKVYQGLRELGFGSPSKVGFNPGGDRTLCFSNETPGMFKNVRSWDKVTISRVAIGQGLTCTVMQLAQAWGALANQGTMMRPYIVDRVVFPNGDTQYSVPQEVSRPISPETANAVTQALKLVTQKGGTGRRASVPGYYIAGKTGTGQQWVPADKSKGIRGHYSNYDYFSSFIGYVPADNPEFLLLVCADHPKAKSSRLNNGGYVSAPAFKQIAMRTLEYLRVPRDYDPELLDKNFAKGLRSLKSVSMRQARR